MVANGLKSRKERGETRRGGELLKEARTWECGSKLILVILSVDYDIVELLEFGVRS